MKAIMIKCAIKVHKNRYVAMIDIPGAYHHMETNEEVIMVLRGKLTELMVAINPKKYKPFIMHDKNGTALLYIKVLKALYSLLQIVLLFYIKMVVDLKKYGFELNPYDACVANKMINGKQMTATWHVNGLKVSHIQPLEVTKFANYLTKIYGPKVKVHQGKIHDYLGIDLDYMTKWKGEDVNDKIPQANTGIIFTIDQGISPIYSRVLQFCVMRKMQ